MARCKLSQDNILLLLFRHHCSQNYKEKHCEKYLPIIISTNPHLASMEDFGPREGCHKQNTWFPDLNTTQYQEPVIFQVIKRVFSEVWKPWAVRDIIYYHLFCNTSNSDLWFRRICTKCFPASHLFYFKEKARINNSDYVSQLSIKIFNSRVGLVVASATAERSTLGSIPRSGKKVLSGLSNRNFSVLAVESWWYDTPLSQEAR